MSFIDEGRLIALFQEACRSGSGVETELWAEQVLSEVTKFNGQGIFQNLSERRLRIKARVVREGRMGQAAVEGPLAEALEGALSRALESAGRGQKVPRGYRFPEPSPLPEVKTCFRRTADFSPGERAERLKKASLEAARPGLELSGSLQVSEAIRTVVNTSGLACSGRTTEANLNYIAEFPTGRSHAGRAARDIDNLDFTGLAREAAQRSQEAQNPQPLEAGDYQVILLPQALADLTPFLGMLVFSAAADQEGRSHISGRLGEEVFSPLVEIWDDATDPRGLPEAFDLEGVAKRKVDLVKAGVPQGFVHDSLTAAAGGVETTGHAFPATPAVYGPIPANLFLGPGQAGLEEMIQEVEHGVLVTRLHYVRCLEAKTVRVGGVTSDGTFLIQGGRISHPVNQMRFSASLIDILGRVTGLGSELVTVRRRAQGPGPVSIHSSAFTLPGVRLGSLGLTPTD